MSDQALLIDVGNTHTDFALATARSIRRIKTLPTPGLTGIPFPKSQYTGAVVASVVPATTRKLLRWLPVKPIMVNAECDLGIAIRYPNKRQLGADRLANAVAVTQLHGAPAIVVDFGTAVTFDIVNAAGAYIGGVIAPGLAAMTDYLHARTALLPRIRLRAVREVVGKSTVRAMQIGAVVGYRGLVKEILAGLLQEPGLRGATVVATGGYGDLIARQIPAIHAVNPRLTLEGLRFIYNRHRPTP